MNNLSMSKVNTAMNDWRRASQISNLDEINYVNSLSAEQKQSYADKWSAADELIQKLYKQIIDMKVG